MTMESGVENIEEGIEAGTVPEAVAADPINQTIYVGSQPCAGCGVVMSPLVVLFGSGLCPVCQNRAYQQQIDRRMA